MNILFNFSLLFIVFPVQIIGQDSIQSKITLKEIKLDAIRIKTLKRTIPFAISHRKFLAQQLSLSKIHFNIIDCRSACMQKHTELCSRLKAFDSWLWCAL